MTNSISEVGFYDALLIIGSNTTEAHPIIGSKMKRAARRGARIIVADPRHIELVDYADIWLRLTPGTDAALVNGMINIIINEGWADRKFMEERCEGYDALWEVVQKYTPAKVSDMSGLRIPEMFDEIMDGKLKAMYVMGENPVLTDADANHVRKAMDGLEFLVVQDIFLTETAKYADVVLPAACYAEKDGTFTNTERRVQRVRKAVEAPGEVADDLPVSTGLAGRLGYEMNYASPEDIFEEVRSLTPAYAGMTYDRLDIAGLQWPCPDIHHPGTPYLHEGTFPRGRGLLQGIEFEAPAELTSEEYPILLTTGRMLYHYNVSTRKSGTLESMAPHELAEINPADAAAIGVSEDNQMRVSSRRGSVVTRVTVTDRVPPGILFMTYHYWETAVNELTNSAFDLSLIHISEPTRLGMI